MIDHLLAGYTADDIFISTSKAYVDRIHEQAPQILDDHIITEPELRDTTAAVGLAAIHIAHRFPHSLMATIWGGDHLIRQRGKFLDSFALAHRLAVAKNLTVQINVRPTFPSPNLGYVEIGEPAHADIGANIYAFKRQVEKPDVATARDFLASVKYLWHTGYRVWHVDTLLRLYEEHLPDAFAALMHIQGAIGTPSTTSVTAEQYHTIIHQSIDYTLYEHLDGAGQAVIAADLGWNDIGTWQVLKDELAPAAEDNCIQGQTLLLNTTGSLVYASTPGKIVAVVGMEDVVIVDTPDALLVIPKDRSAEIKAVIEQLKAQGQTKYI
jgi:mannose-1-phosphate guanylyltransferase